MLSGPARVASPRRRAQQKARKKGDFWEDETPSSAPNQIDSKPQNDGQNDLDLFRSNDDGGAEEDETLKQSNSQEQDPDLPRYKAPKPPEEKKSKKKLIDVLPLLHKGIKMNKFKMQKGAKCRVRHFFLTKDNTTLCWSPNEVKQSDDSDQPQLVRVKSLDMLLKSQDDRSISLRTVNEIRRNPAETLKELDFIPHKALTLTVIYTQKNVQRMLNVMAYNKFHFQLMCRGLESLVLLAADSSRKLQQVFELPLEFDKDILPRHLRPQKFKWEPLKNDGQQVDEEEKKPGGCKSARGRRE